MKLTIKRCWACQGPLATNYAGPVYCSHECRQGANALERILCPGRPTGWPPASCWEIQYCDCGAHFDRKVEFEQYHTDDGWAGWDLYYNEHVDFSEWLLGCDQLNYWPHIRERQRTVNWKLR